MVSMPLDAVTFDTDVPFVIAPPTRIENTVFGAATVRVFENALVLPSPVPTVKFTVGSGYVDMADLRRLIHRVM